MAVRNRWLAELALFAALATLHTWPMPADPAHLTRLDNNDTAFNTWVVAWVAHQVIRDPLRLFQAPIFHPETNALAFSEHMVVPSLMGAPLLWGGASPVLVYNLLVWLGFALSGFAMCVVVRRWTGSSTAGVVSGCLYAFNAHLLTRYPHLQALHMEFFPIVLYAFDRLLDAPRVRTALLLAAAFAAQALCANYTMVMIAGALAVALIVRREPWVAGALPRWRMLALAGLIVAAVVGPFLWPYYRVRIDQGFVRTFDDVRLYSADSTDYLSTAGRVHYALWSHRFSDGQTALFPGFTAAALALVAVARGLAWRDRRARMAMAFGLLGFAMSFGASLPGYGVLYDTIPLLQSMRGASRWGLLPLIAIAILSGFAVAWLQERWRGRVAWRLIAIVLVVLVTMEALRAPLDMQRFDRIRDVHARLGHIDARAIVVFPFYPGREFHQNAPYLLDQTRHWVPMINAYSSWAPRSFHRIGPLLQSFPDETAMNELRAAGVSHVVLHRPPLERAFGAAAIAGLRAHPQLEFVFEEDGVIVYRLRR